MKRIAMLFSVLVMFTVGLSACGKNSSPSAPSPSAQATATPTDTNIPVTPVITPTIQVTTVALQAGVDWSTGVDLSKPSTLFVAYGAVTQMHVVAAGATSFVGPVVNVPSGQGFKAYVRIVTTFTGPCTCHVYCKVGGSTNPPGIDAKPYCSYGCNGFVQDFESSGTIAY